MKESDFQKKLLKSLREQGWWAYKIPDMPKSDGARFIPEKPGDIITARKAESFSIQAILIECKQIKGIKGFNRTLFQSSKDKKNNLPFEEWNQVKSLNEFNDKAGVSYAAINIINKKDEKGYDYLLLFQWWWLYGFFAENKSFTKSMVEYEIEKHGIKYNKGYDCESIKVL